MLQESNKVSQNYSNLNDGHLLRKSTCGFHYYKKFLLNKCRIKRLQQRRAAQRRLYVIEEQEFHDFDIFHRAINSCIFFCHIFGIMPLKNTLHSNPNKLKFQLQCIPMFCTAWFLLCGGWKFLYHSAKLFETGINAKNIVGMVFFLVTLLTCFQFIGLAKNWPKLVQYWTRVEMIFLLPPYEQVGWTLKRKLITLATCFAAIALVEHTMYYASTYTNHRMKILHCEKDHTKASFVHFVRTEFQDVFTVLPFNLFSSCFAFFLNFNFTLIWNYMDLFIMLVGVSLTTRLRQFAVRMEKLKRLHVPDTLWYNIRQHHTQLCELMEYVDEHISSIILIAAMNNMYFICYQLLNIFTKLRWPINYIYRWFSLLFLIGRTASSFMFTASVHEASLAPLKILYLVPAGYWTEEVQRFMSQLTNQCMALTGKRFYYVTRKSLFGFFTTIVTYELVLLQLDRHSHNAKLPNICD